MLVLGCVLVRARDAGRISDALSFYLQSRLKVGSSAIYASVARSPPTDLFIYSALAITAMRSVNIRDIIYSRVFVPIATFRYRLYLPLRKLHATMQLCYVIRYK